MLNRMKGPCKSILVNTLAIVTHSHHKLSFCTSTTSKVNATFTAESSLISIMILCGLVAYANYNVTIEEFEKLVPNIMDINDNLPKGAKSFFAIIQECKYISAFVFKQKLTNKK